MERLKKWADGTFPLHRPYSSYTPFIALLTFSYVKDDIEVFMLYFLFTGTNYQCDFKVPFGKSLYATAILQIFLQPSIAYLTDTFAEYSTFLLWFSIFLELLFEIIMFTMPSITVTMILALQLLRSMAHVQNTDAIWKIFKQKLLCDLGENPALHEDIINVIAVWGICGSVCLDCAIFLGGYGLSVSGHSFTEVAYYIYFLTAFLTFVAMVLAYLVLNPKFIRRVYPGTNIYHFDKALELEEKKDSIKEEFEPSTIAPSDIQTEIHDNIRDRTKKQTIEMTEMKAAEISDLQIEAQPSTESIDPIPADTSCDIMPINCGPLGLATSTPNLEDEQFYFWKSILHMWNNPVIRYGVVHATFVCLVWKLMSGAQPLKIANDFIKDEDPTPENFCAGAITNLFLQYGVNNVVYIIGALLYLFFLCHVKPLLYFQSIYPVCALLFILCVLPFLLFALNYWIEIALASIVGVLPWYLYRYDEYMVYSACDTKYLGTLTGIIGFIRYTAPSLSGILLDLGLERITALCTVILLVLSIGFSFFFYASHKKNLAAMQAIK